MIRLEVEQGEAKGRSCEREDVAEITVGRAPNSDLLIPDWHVSGAHGVIRVNRETAKVIYLDRRSTNGSRVRRGGAILPVDSTAGFERELLHGDELLLGDPEQSVVVRVAVRVLVLVFYHLF